MPEAAFEMALGQRRQIAREFELFESLDHQAEIKDLYILSYHHCYDVCLLL